mmetsp:Transcript_8792/g.27974  ORF Transcript_8792/g.27974 Transcript_8792/m.27974 type:complete len:317 (+) Transcript_8792:423-1373(+)
MRLKLHLLELHLLRERHLRHLRHRPVEPLLQPPQPRPQVRVLCARLVEQPARLEQHLVQVAHVWRAGAVRALDNRRRRRRVRGRHDRRRRLGGHVVLDDPLRQQAHARSARVEADGEPVCACVARAETEAGEPFEGRREHHQVGRVRELLDGQVELHEEREAPIVDFGGERILAELERESGDPVRLDRHRLGGRPIQPHQQRRARVLLREERLHRLHAGVRRLDHQRDTKHEPHHRRRVALRGPHRDLEAEGPQVGHLVLGLAGGWLCDRPVNLLVHKPDAEVGEVGRGERGGHGRLRIARCAPQLREQPRRAPVI